MNAEFDLLIIGAGPGGYVAAIRAAQLGLRVALVERDRRLGGTCLRIGCIPSKALLESSRIYEMLSSDLGDHGLSITGAGLDIPALMRRKERVVEQLTSGVAKLITKNGVTVVRGEGRLAGPKTVLVAGQEGKRELTADNILLATGSAPVELAQLPFDGERIVSSREALAFEKVPGRLLVVGAGAIGLELGQVWQRLGARVTIVEMLPQIAPFADKPAARLLLRALKDKGIEFHLGTRVEAATVEGDVVLARLTDGRGKTSEIDCDRVLVAVGRRAYSEGLGLAEAGVTLDERGRVAIDDEFKTSVGSLRAIGDLVAGPMLAHRAQDEGLAVAELLAGLPATREIDIIPAVVYTHPELAMVGKTEEQCKAEGLAFTSGRFYFKANGRALTAGDAEGMVKLLAAKDDGKILGVHILGPSASELIAEATLAMKLGASADDLAGTIHAHPTLSEALKEAALAACGRAIHA